MIVRRIHPLIQQTPFFGLAANFFQIQTLPIVREFDNYVLPFTTDIELKQTFFLFLQFLSLLGTLDSMRNRVANQMLQWRYDLVYDIPV